MKRDFLENLDIGSGAKLSKSAIDAIMAEHGKAMEGKNNQIVSLTTERDGLRTQLGDANATIQSYKDMDIDGIKARAGEWETKYNTDTQALRDQLDAANYGFAVKDAANGYKFSSEAAKKAFCADLIEKKLPMQDGKLLGLADFIKGYKEADPDAFAPEGGKVPVATRGTGSGAELGKDAALREAFGLPANTTK